MKTLNVPFSICQIKISNNPSHSLSMYDIFNGENSKLSTLTIFMLAQAGFLWCIMCSLTKNIMTLILKTNIWHYRYSKTKYRSRQTICIGSWIQVYAWPKFYTDTYTKDKTLKGRRDCVFQGKVKKT